MTARSAPMGCRGAEARRVETGPMNIAFAAPDPEVAEISEATGSMLTRLGGLEIARGLLDSDDKAARSADAALLEFGLLDLAACQDPAQPASLHHLAAVLGALGTQVLAARYIPGLVQAHLATALGLEAPAAWTGAVAFWDSPCTDLAWARNARSLVVHVTGDAAKVEGLAPTVVGDLSDGVVFIPTHVDGDDLLLMSPLRATGIAVRNRPSLSPTLQISDLAFQGAACRVAARGEAARMALRSAHRLALCAVASAQAQAAGAAAQMATTYARERFQFGLPIGSFQAIKHRCADMYIEAQLARSMADGAAADAGNPDAPHAAKAFCGDAYRVVTTKAVQIHGGIGITWEHAAHLYLRDAHATATLLGGGAAHRRILAERAAASALKAA